MKRLALISVVALTPVFAQIGPPPRPAAEVPVGSAAAKPATVAGSITPGSRVVISRKTFKLLEDNFNLKFTTFNPTDPVYMLGLTRGLYLQGYGVVFSTELDLINAPTVSPFHQKILAEEVVSTHLRKLKQLAQLRQAARDEMVNCAKSLEAVPGNEQVVMVIRLDYQPWEDTVGLPSQIMLRADRRSAAAGQVTLEEQ